MPNFEGIGLCLGGCARFTGLHQGELAIYWPAWDRDETTRQGRRTDPVRSNDVLRATLVDANNDAKACWKINPESEAEFALKYDRVVRE